MAETTEEVLVEADAVNETPVAETGAVVLPFAAEDEAVGADVALVLEEMETQLTSAAQVALDEDEGAQLEIAA